VVNIESIRREGPCISFQARVVDSDGPDTTLEHTVTFSEEELRSLKGAQVALEALLGGNKTEDEDEDGCCICIGWFPLYFTSWLTQFLPKKCSLAFACAGAAPPATIPPATINTNTELLVIENNVAPYAPRTLLLLISIMLAWS
jgi:hypothetical protein